MGVLPETLRVEGSPIEQTDTNQYTYLDSYAGGGHVLGEWSELTLRTSRPVVDGAEERRRDYVAVSGSYLGLHRLGPVAANAAREFERLQALRKADDNPTMQAIGEALDPMQEAIERSVFNICRMFDNIGLAGAAKHHTLDVLGRLLYEHPLGPLTGEDSEWDGNLPIDSGGDPENPKAVVAVNRRCDRVVLLKDGTAADIQGLLFEDTDGSHYLTPESVRQIEFPYDSVRRNVIRRPKATEAADGAAT